MKTTHQITGSWAGTLVALLLLKTTMGMEAAMMAASHDLPSPLRASMVEAIPSFLPVSMTWLVAGAALFYRHRSR